MIRTDLTRPVRSGAALAAIAGVAVLAGCASGATGDPESTDSAPQSGADTSSTQSAGSGASTYTDGTYTADGSYQTPESVETISVTVTLDGDVITEVEVTGDPQRPESKQYQGEFIGGISDEVVGQDIDEISVTRVAGSSLTSGGFNDAIDQIKADAAA